MKGFSKRVQNNRPELSNVLQVCLFLMNLFEQAVWFYFTKSLRNVRYHSASYIFYHISSSIWTL